jgi:hypothetical protein
MPRYLITAVGESSTTAMNLIREFKALLQKISEDLPDAKTGVPSVVADDPLKLKPKFRAAIERAGYTIERRKLKPLQVEQKVERPPRSGVRK